jgi:hypothetical protein
MSYTLHRLAAGSYDLLLDGIAIGSVARDVTNGGFVKGWDVELLSADLPLPIPFEREAYRFDTLEAAIAWLGKVTIEDDG